MSSASRLSGSALARWLPRRPRVRRSAARAAIGLALVAVARSANAAQPCEPADLGCSIFSGQHAVSAHLRDDDRPLPAWTTRCINCHTQTEPAAAFAPPFTPDYLLAATRRRGLPVATIQRPSVTHSRTASIRQASRCASPCLTIRYPPASAQRFGASSRTTSRVLHAACGASGCSTSRHNSETSIIDSLLIRALKASLASRSVVGFRRDVSASWTCS